MAKREIWPPMTIGAELKKIAPNIAFSISREEDPNFEWDGEGPDPREEGYVPYDVDVYARAIVDGEEIQGRASMGGTYDTPGKPDPDIHGYFPQMLREAVDELEAVASGPVKSQAKLASRFLSIVMRDRYNAQVRSRR